MSRFNVKKTPPAPDTSNLAGGKAYKESTKLELVSILLTSFLNDKFYESANSQANRLVEAIKNLPDKKFAAKAAIYARNVFGMRSITHLTAAIIAGTVKGVSWTKDFFYKVFFRPDDMLETMSLYFTLFTKNMRPVPNSLKKAIKAKFENPKKNGGFDEYQLAKYRKSENAISLVDLINLTHPSPEKNSAIHKLIRNTLKLTGKTWEAKLSEAGKADDVEEAKAGAWESLLSSGKLGYMALLKNLRNINATGNSNIIDLAVSELLNVEKLKASKVFPFRFFTAYKELQKAGASRKLLNAVHDAVDLSLRNIPDLPGKTLIALDVSGSMTSPINSRTSYRSVNPSALSIMDVSAMFAAALYKHLDADLIRFQSSASYYNTTTRLSTLKLAEDLVNTTYGGTNFESIFKTANKKYDRIIILSDMQSWIGSTISSFKTYKSTYQANPYLYCMDFAGYGTLQFPENKIVVLAGYSDKILDLMKINEEDKNILIQEIESIEL